MVLLLSTEVLVRPFVEEDRQEVIGLWTTVFPDDPSWNEPNLVIDTKLTVQPQLFFVAEVAGSVVGTTIAGFDGFRGWIHHVAVHPDFQGSGVAAKIITHAEVGLKKIGCRKVNLQVCESNSTVREFYEARGFKAEARLSFGKLLSTEVEVRR
jgi:ribosomal protein S18 acetylase RimI-like enzyme